MANSKILPLNIGVIGKQHVLPYSCDIQRSKRKTLALYIKHRTVIVRCPLRASKREVHEFISSNTAWIEERLLEEAQREREMLRIERGAKIFYRARELTIVFREGRKKRILISGDKFIIQGHKLNSAKAREQVEDYLIDKALSLIHI